VDAMMMELREGLGRIAKALNLNFTLNGRPLSYPEVFSDMGMLPALAKRADQLCSLCLGYGLGVTFTEAEGSRLGIKSIFDDDTPATLRYLCITDVLYELMHAAPSKGQVPLDDLMYD
jgi:intracellular multiplication protein IcmS